MFFWLLIFLSGGELATAIIVFSMALIVLLPMRALNLFEGEQAYSSVSLFIFGVIGILVGMQNANYILIPAVIYAIYTICCIIEDVKENPIFLIPFRYLWVDLRAVAIFCGLLLCIMFTVVQIIILPLVFFAAFFELVNSDDAMENLAIIKFLDWIE